MHRVYDGAMDYLSTRAARGDGGTPDPAGGDARPGESLRHEELRFPGCTRITLTRDEFEEYDDRIEYWDARSETAWIVADKYGVHEGTSRRLPHLAERIASLRGTPIVSYGSVTLLVRDEAGEPRRAMEADETLYLHPTRAATPRKSLIIGENDFPDVVLEVDHTTDVRPGKLLLYEAWGFPELWVIVPPEGASPRRPAGVTIHRLQDGRYRSMPTSGAFPGWTAGEIYDAMTEPTPSAATCRVLERVGRTLGAREGNRPCRRSAVERADRGRAPGGSRAGTGSGGAEPAAGARAGGLAGVRSARRGPRRRPAGRRDGVRYACVDEADFWRRLAVDSRGGVKS